MMVSKSVSTDDRKHRVFPTPTEVPEILNHINTSNEDLTQPFEPGSQ